MVKEKTIKHARKRAALVRWRKERRQPDHNEIPAVTGLTEPEVTEGSVTEISTSDVLASTFTGRRIVKLDYFWNQIKNISHHPLFNCNIQDCDIIHESRYGLLTTLKIKCNVCNKLSSIRTEPSTSADVNKSTVLGTISVGAGYTQMNEMLTTMELPPITPLLFTKVQRTLQDNVHATLMEQLALAGKEEKKLAIERGDVDGNGVPFITVIADGAWSKRSYKTNYNALSGVAVIIGEATKKVLFMGVKNKFCIVCVRTRGKEHVCAKNWTGSSTSMESAIIMEGFKNSEAMHGVRYTKLIGDGDSSITKKLLEEKPYGAVLVEKVECVNHLLRNMCNKLKEITKSTRSSSLLKNISVALRKKLGNNILKFRTSIKKAAEFRNKEPTDFLKKVNDFKKDVLNSPNHIFGEHKNCDTYFCDKKDKNENIVPMLKECGMYQDICFALQRIVGCASSILLNKNNNPAEQFNAVVNKFVGGKRINFSGQKSYEMRCELAAISYNCKDNYFLEILKSAGIEAGHFIKNLVRDKGLKRKREAQFKEKRIKKKYKQTLANHEPDADYGAIEETLSAEELERRKIKLQTILKKTDEEILDLEKNTRGQGSNHRWLEERSCRLTASNFGLICKRRKANPHLLAKRLYSNPFTGNKSTRYGLDFEPLAINTFQEATGLKVNSCGLFVGRDEEYFLGASPDGVIGTDSILEIKCPAVLKKISVEDGISSKKIKYLQIDESGKITLKQNHNYYYQIQGQLHLSNKKYCYFMVWSPVNFHIEKIEKLDRFWETNMRKQLCNFFTTHYITEIIKHPI